MLLLLLSRFSRVRLCATPWTAAHQAPPSLGFSRQDHWSGLPFPSPMHESEKWKWSRSVVFDSLWPHEPQHTRPRCPSPTPRAYPNSCPSSRWCHPTISSSVVPFSSRLQSFPASGSFPMSQFFALGGQRIGVSASASVLPMNIQDWFPLGLTAWISLWYWRNWDPEEQTLAQSHRATRVQVWALVWSQGKPILTAVPSEKWCVWSHGIALAQLHPWIFLLPWAWPEISEPNMEVLSFEKNVPVEPYIFRHRPEASVIRSESKHGVVSHMPSTSVAEDPQLIPDMSFCT